MTSVLVSLKRLCQSVSTHSDSNELVQQWAKAVAMHAPIDATSQEEAYKLTRRLATELQPFLLDNLHRWTLSVDAWLQNHFILASACEFTNEVTIELSAIADQLSAAWTRQTLMEFCQAVQHIFTASPTQSPTQTSSFRSLLPEIDRGLSPMAILEEELFRRRKDVLDGMVCNLTHNLRLIDDVMLLFDNDVELQQRISTAVSMPRLMKTIYTFFRSPPDAFMGHCASPNEPQQWFVTFAMCCLGEISGAPRLRGAAVAAPSTVEVKQELLREWVVRYQQPIEKACLSYRRHLRANVVSSDKQLLEIDPCSFFTANMLDLLPCLDQTIDRATSSSQRITHQITHQVVHSPYGVSIRTLRLLQTIKHVQGMQRLNRINTSVLYNLLHRIEKEQTVSTGQTHALALATQAAQDDPSVHETASFTAKPSRNVKMEAVCLFLRTIQTIVGQESELLVVNGRRVSSRVLSFEDLATNMKLVTNMSTSQRLSKLVEGLLRNCVDEVGSGHIRYMRASEMRKKRGMGRNGRKIHNHLVVTEYGLHRCRSIASELLLLHEASLATFWKRWSSLQPYPHRGARLLGQNA